MDEIPDGGALAVDLPTATSSLAVIVTRRGDQIAAFRNECPHAGRRLDWAPGRFLVEGSLLVCAAHGASFVLDTGAAVGGPCRGVGLTSVAIGVRDGFVFAD